MRYLALRPGPHLRTIFHDQADRQRHRTRAGDCAQHRHRTRWPDSPGKHARSRNKCDSRAASLARKRGGGAMSNGNGREVEILVVDDDRELADTLREVLSAEG